MSEWITRGWIGVLVLCAGVLRAWNLPQVLVET